tara:strand:- start:666 stop:1181 length:516 start_codon:yes stop_codon:yes gene_type:complete
MNKNRRRYVKENGRTALRKMSKRRTPPRPIYLDNMVPLNAVVQVGEFCKIWSPIYCSWVWEAKVQINGLILRREVFEDKPEEAIAWARAKYTAIKNPQFARILHGYIMSSDYALVDIAEVCGVTENAISKWIAGDTFPSVVALVRLCEMLSGDNWETEYNKLSKMIEMERV